MKPIFALLALATPLLGSAQTTQQEAAAAAAPSITVPPVHYTPMAPTGVSGLATEGEDWKAANASVGQYRRGHIDILKAERSQQPLAPRPAPEPQR